MYEQRTQRTVLSERVLIFCLLSLTAIIVWQNAVAPTWYRLRAAKPAIIVPRGDLADDERSAIELFNKASPSAVHITTHSLDRDFFSMNVTEIPQGEGTGIVWDSYGHIVTNFHVIKNADTVHVSLLDQSIWQAKFGRHCTNTRLGSAQDRRGGKPLHSISVGTSADLQVGQKVFAIGNPFGLDQSLTTGLIGAVGREIISPALHSISDVIQTDAAINPGNSGGPLLDSHGRLIGVNTAIVSPSGTYAGIGFAIPVDTVNWVTPELIANGRIIRPGLAVNVAPEALTKRLGVGGVLVLTVEPGSEATAAGLRPTRRDRIGNVFLGDIITAVNETEIGSPHDLLNALEGYKIAELVTLTIRRGRQKVQVQVELEAR